MMRDDLNTLLSYVSQMYDLELWYGLA